MSSMFELFLIPLITKSIEGHITLRTNNTSVKKCLKMLQEGINVHMGRCNQGQNMLLGFSGQHVTHIVKMYQILSNKYQQFSAAVNMKEKMQQM